MGNSRHEYCAFEAITANTLEVAAPRLFNCMLPMRKSLPVHESVHLKKKLEVFNLQYSET